MAKKRNILGAMSPWAWAVEVVRGCNLRCGHCTVRMWDTAEAKHVPEPMGEETWIALWKVIRAVTPRCRVEMANAGEPTLHPMLPEFIKVAREISPESHIQVTTNGTMLAKGKLTHRQLFDAGCNIVYVDMYAPRETHEELAKASGVQWYYYFDKPPDAPGAWTYGGPDLKLIVLMNHPGDWPEGRRNSMRLGTFLNQLDWKAAAKFDLEPVTEPLQRGCTQPFRYVSINAAGEYQLCCQDFSNETTGPLGSVHDGPQGFMRFWYSEFMQQHRLWLRERDRASSPYCSRCNIVYSRADWRMWKDDQLRLWYDGTKWHPMNKSDAEAAKVAADASGTKWDEMRKGT